MCNMHLSRFKFSSSSLWILIYLTTFLKEHMSCHVDNNRALVKCTFQEKKIASKPLRKKYCPLEVWKVSDNSDRGFFHQNVVWLILKENKVKFSFWKIFPAFIKQVFLKRDGWSWSFLGYICLLKMKSSTYR